MRKHTRAFSSEGLQVSGVSMIRQRANWPWVGSAQQNQDSLSRGGRIRSGAKAALGRA